MPIVYVHGVNNRDRKGFLALEPYLRRYVAPVLAADPDQVRVDDVFWGDQGVTFAWAGASRPRSQLIGMGADARPLEAVEGALTAAVFADALRRLPAAAATPVGGGGLGASGSAQPAATAPTLSLRQLDRDDLAELLTAAIVAADPVPSPARTARILAADAVAMDLATGVALAAAATPEAEIRILVERVRAATPPSGDLAAMGGDGYWTKLGDRVAEAGRRALGLPTYAVSVVAAELRKPLNEMVSVFLGDVFVYLRGRGDAASPGPIPRRLLDKLRAAQDDARRRDGEPLVVLTHSMGGQLVYDALTHFLPLTPGFDDIRIDYWCACASQVGFFEEAKLFLASDATHRTGHPVPFPKAHLGHWWNVWDHNDFLSFTAQGIVDGVDDGAYSSGMSLVSAHGGYLEQPSFFRALATRLEGAKAHGWGRP